MHLYMEETNYVDGHACLSLLIFLACEIRFDWLVSGSLSYPSGKPAISFNFFPLLHL
jgi:hypothetical protein